MITLHRIFVPCSFFFCVKYPYIINLLPCKDIENVRLGCFANVLIHIVLQNPHSPFFSFLRRL